MSHIAPEKDVRSIAEEIVEQIPKTITDKKQQDVIIELTGLSAEEILTIKKALSRNQNGETA